MMSYPAEGDHRLELFIFKATFGCLLLFAAWTLLLQLGTFCRIPWEKLTYAAGWLVAPSILAAYFTVTPVGKVYVGYLPRHLAVVDAQSPWQAVSFLAVTGVFLLFFQDFAYRWTLFITVCCIAALLLNKSLAECKERIVINDVTAQYSTRFSIFLLVVAVAVTLFIVLAADRSDMDDPGFIFYAMQTLLHPHLPPNTFDASLGIVIDKFQFAPYRATSYETFIALLSQWTALPVLDVYYLLVPGIMAIVSIGIAFCFLRYFLSREHALWALILFIVLVLSWGETHHAYGNRVFVRLFQGKGLLVSIAAPASILLSILWVRSRNIFVWLVLAATIVISLGFSSTGMISACFAVAIGLASAFATAPSRSALRSVFLGLLPLSYLVLFGAYVKWISPVAGKIESIGSYIPIGASLGGPWREALALLILLSCPLFWFIHELTKKGAATPETRQTKTLLTWLIFFTCFLGFNPVIADFLANHSARNMSWRLAWSAPVPLLMACCLLLLLSSFTKGGCIRFAKRSIGFVGAVLLGAFLLCDRWAIAPDNGTSWNFMGYKTAPSFARTQEAVAHIRGLYPERKNITVLAEGEAASWMPVVAPDFKLIMTDGNSIMCLSTIIPHEEMSRRLQLVANIRNIAAGDRSLDALLEHYGVDFVILSNAAPGEPYQIVELYPGKNTKTLGQ